jgi:transcriptional regulator with XRE-family HTH domain
MDLKLRRVAARVKMADLSERMGRSRATLHNYERMEIVPAGVAEKYVAALETFREVATGEPIQVRPLAHADQPTEAA